MSSASSSEQATLLHREAPCGCVIQMGSGSGEEGLQQKATTTAGEGGGGGGCPCEECGAGCRCIATKGKCDCGGKGMAKVVAPLGCTVDTGSEEVCPTCGMKGCRCIATKGRCDCMENK